MDDYGYSLSEITVLVRQVAERAPCKVVHWRQDPRDSRYLFVMARLRLLPLDVAPVHLEVLLPPRQTL